MPLPNTYRGGKEGLETGVSAGGIMRDELILRRTDPASLRRMATSSTMQPSKSRVGSEGPLWNYGPKVKGIHIVHRIANIL